MFSDKLQNCFGNGHVWNIPKIHLHSGRFGAKIVLLASRIFREYMLQRQHGIDACLMYFPFQLFQMHGWMSLEMVKLYQNDPYKFKWCFFRKTKGASSRSCLYMSRYTVITSLCHHTTMRSMIYASGVCQDSSFGEAWWGGMNPFEEQEGVQETQPSPWWKPLLNPCGLEGKGYFRWRFFLEGCETSNDHFPTALSENTVWRWLSVHCRGLKLSMNSTCHWEEEKVRLIW